MKKIYCALLALGLLLSFGCTAADPAPTAAPMASASMPPAVLTPADSGAAPGVATPGTNSNGMETQAPAMGGMTTIPDFVEGKQVSESEAPAVVNAVKAEYPNATIKSITHETHENRQMYHVILESAATKEIYVDAMGVITPYTAQASPAASPKASPAG